MSYRLRDARDAKKHPLSWASGCKTLARQALRRPDFGSTHSSAHTLLVVVVERRPLSDQRATICDRRTTQRHDAMPALDTASGAHDSPIASSDDESPFTVFSFRPQRRPRSLAPAASQQFVIGLSCVALAATVSIRSLRRQTRVPEYLAATHTRPPSRQPTHRPTVGDATCGMKANQQPIDCDKWDQGSCAATRAASWTSTSTEPSTTPTTPWPRTSRAAAATASTPRRRRATPSDTSPRTTRATTRSSSPLRCRGATRRVGFTRRAAATSTS